MADSIYVIKDENQEEILAIVKDKNRIRDYFWDWYAKEELIVEKYILSGNEYLHLCTFSAITKGDGSHQWYIPNEDYYDRHIEWRD